MPDECQSYDKVMKYVLAGAGLMLVGYIFFKYQNKSQTASLSQLNPKITQLEEEIYILKTQLKLTQEQLEGLTQSQEYKLQSSSPQSSQSLSQPHMTVQKMDSKEEQKRRQQFFNMA